MKTKYHNASINRCGTGSKFEIFGVVLKGGAYCKKRVTLTS